MAYNDNISYDYEYGARMKWLIKLMELYPNKPVRKLLKESLKYYPVSSQEMVRNWLSIRTAFKAADIMNKEIFDEQDAIADAFATFGSLCNIRV